VVPCLGGGGGRAEVRAVCGGGGPCSIFTVLFLRKFRVASMCGMCVRSGGPHRICARWRRSLRGVRGLVLCGTYVGMGVFLAGCVIVGEFGYAALMVRSVVGSQVFFGGAGRTSRPFPHLSRPSVRRGRGASRLLFCPGVAARPRRSGGRPRAWQQVCGKCPLRRKVAV